MLSITHILILAALTGGFSFFFFKSRLTQDKIAGKFLFARPHYYGMYAALLLILPVFFILLIWPFISQSLINANLGGSVKELGFSGEQFNLILACVKQYQISGIDLNSCTMGQHQEVLIPVAEANQSFAKNILWIRTFAVVLTLGGIFYYLWKTINPSIHAREHVETILRTTMLICAVIAIITTFGILFSVLYESLLFFQKYPALEFFFGTEWNPQTAMRADQIASEGAFGIIPLLTGTLLISLIALFLSVPIGLGSAIYLSEYASATVRGWGKPLLELLAGIPTVVYGFFAALTVAPLIRNFGQTLGMSVASESALAAGLVMGVMMIPFVSSLSDDVINSVPNSLREASTGLGATESETICKIVLPAALPGIISAFLLAASRAIGETMIVVMAAGLSANLTFNPLEAVTTVTVQIVTLLQGDQEFDSTKTLSAFALGLTLFVITFCLNLYALHCVKKYHERYS